LRTRKEKAMTDKPVQAETYRHVVQAMASIIEAKKIVEVGVFDGLLSRMLADLPGVHLTIVDPWLPYKKFDQKFMDQVAQTVISWAKSREDKDVQVMRMKSITAAHGFESETFDFFHTDSNLSGDKLKEELRAWHPKIKRGGVMTGDNYEHLSIAQAVDEVFPNRRLAAKGRVWWVVL